MSGVVQSQDTYAAPGIALSVIGSGGGGGIPENLMVSTISALGLLNISSINGVPYAGPVLPANANFSSISSFAIAASSINATNIDDIPYTYAQPQGLVDTVISSIVTTSNITFAAAVQAMGAPLTGFVSTIPGHKYSVNGVMELSTIGAGGFPSGNVSTVNAYISIWGGGGIGGSWVNNSYWSYPQISTLSQMSAANGTLPNFFGAKLQWNAGGGHSQLETVNASTIRYFAYCSPDWPVPINVGVSSIVGRVTYDDLATVTITDMGDVNISGTG